MGFLVRDRIIKLKEQREWLVEEYKEKKQLRKRKEAILDIERDPFEQEDDKLCAVLEQYINLVSEILSVERRIDRIDKEIIELTNKLYNS
jgi:hypothetical protein